MEQQNLSIIDHQAKVIEQLTIRVQELERMPLSDHPDFHTYERSVDTIIDCQRNIIDDLQRGIKPRRFKN